MLATLEEIVRTLRRAELLRRLSESQLRNLAQAARPHVYRRDQAVTAEADDYLMVANGEICVELLSLDGEELYVRRARTGQLFDLGATAEHPETQMIAKATAEGTRVYRLARGTLVSAMVQSAGVEELIEFERQSAAAVQQSLAGLAFHGVRERLARTLLDLGEDADDDTIVIRHDDLACWAATTRQRVTEHLSAFRRLGLIEYRPHNHRIRILDHECPAREAGERGRRRSLMSFWGLKTNANHGSVNSRWSAPPQGW